MIVYLKEMKQQFWNCSHQQAVLPWVNDEKQASQLLMTTYIMPAPSTHDGRVVGRYLLAESLKSPSWHIQGLAYLCTLEVIHLSSK
jgi:hypothetical protein|mmetsp:Transcript_21896/g.67447  ORF Transcript_21896/g.67447 Transcript_21896/m.67447 type:complete len:86 (-) Transcript_21896:4767-5024(-)